MAIAYRRANAGDLVKTDALVVGSINELTERRGFGKIASPHPPLFQLFSLADDPEGLWLAEEDGDILGFGWSWQCGDLWFLAQLFVSPARQGGGIGHGLIERTWQPAQAKGARSKALITFTFNPVSQGLYLRHGMYPRFPIYMFSAPREKLAGHPQDATLRSVPLTDGAHHLSLLAAIDAASLDVSREKHHRYLIADKATRAVLLYRGEHCVGYAYIADGHIGPLAVTEPGAMAAAFRTALALALEGDARHISAFVPGANEAALDIAAGYGMSIALPMLLMSSRAFGDWARYLPRNPGFM